MQVLNMKLSNFQGIKNLEIDFDGSNTNIYGDNGTGKTTVFNAFTWLLYGKDSTGIKGYTPKSYEGNEEAHNLEHIASMDIKLDSGTILSFKKVFKEVYKKKRGSNIKSFDGHTTDYYIDDIPVKEKDYIDSIEANLADIDTLKVFTDVMYFNEKIDWQTRRKILTSVFGDISDFEIIEKNKELTKLKNYLLKKSSEDQYYSVDDYTLIVKEKMKAINKELKGIPDRISEVSNLIVTNKDKMLSEEEIEALKKDLEVMENNAKKLSETKEALKLPKGEELNLMTSIMDVKTRFLKAESDYNYAISKESEGIRKEIEEANKEAETVQNSLTSTKNTISSLEAEIDEKTKVRATLIAEINAVKSKVRDNSNDICPTCGRVFEAEQIAKADELFEKSKNVEIAKLTEKGKAECSKEMIASLSEKLKTLQKMKDTFDESLKVKTKHLNEVKSKEVIKPYFKETIEGMALYSELEDLQHKLNTLNETSTAPNTDNLDKKIKELESKILVTTEKISNTQTLKSVIESAKERVKELEESECNLAKEFEEFEKKLALLEEFIRVKSRYITDEINKNFENIKFKLFDTQVNGGLKETCTALVPSKEGNLVPFEKVNTGAKINAGLEVIDVLGNKQGINLPVFIDNAESITKIAEVSNQVITLRVSEADKKLRIERG